MLVSANHGTLVELEGLQKERLALLETHPELQSFDEEREQEYRLRKKCDWLERMPA